MIAVIRLEDRRFWMGDNSFSNTSVKRTTQHCSVCLSYYIPLLYALLEWTIYSVPIQPMLYGTFIRYISTPSHFPPCSHQICPLYSVGFGMLLRPILPFAILTSTPSTQSAIPLWGSGLLMTRFGLRAHPSYPMLRYSSPSLHRVSCPRWPLANCLSPLLRGLRLKCLAQPPPLLLELLPTPFDLQARGFRPWLLHLLPTPYRDPR